MKRKRVEAGHTHTKTNKKNKSNQIYTATMANGDYWENTRKQNTELRFFFFSRSVLFSLFYCGVYIFHSNEWVSHRSFISRTT